ncbi:ABC transporter ATP-binding protein [Chloroflexota bacterium]
MNTTESVAVNIHGLNKSYKNVIALKSLDLTILKHSIIGFLGPNGAGKTTTIKLLLGLIRPTGGKATVFGYDINHESLEIRRHIGYLAQDVSYYKNMTARDILRFRARFFYSGPKAKIEEHVAQSLELVGLTDKADRPIKGFSGGECQRLGIAQALINSPDLLILDEPAASLDPMGRRDVLNIMQGLREKTTIFYSTHIIDDVQRVSDTVAILNHGELVAHAPIEVLLAEGDGNEFTLTIKGDSHEAYKQVSSQPWVSSVKVIHDNGKQTWQVSVTNKQRAETELLRLVQSHGSAIVTEFGKRKHDLEEVFMNLIKEGNND